MGNREPRRCWTPEEDAVVRANYDTMTDEAVGLLLDRTRASVRHRRVEDLRLHRSSPLRPAKKTTPAVEVQPEPIVLAPVVDPLAPFTPGPTCAELRIRAIRREVSTPYGTDFVSVPYIAALDPRAA